MNRLVVVMIAAATVTGAEAAFTMSGAGANGMRRTSDVQVQSFKLHFAPRASVAPKLDGKLNDACWQGVAPICDYGPCTIQQNPLNAIPRTEVRLVWDDKYLYVGAKCYEDTPENMASFLRIVNDGKRAFHGRDCIEMHIDGNNDEHTTFQGWLLANHEKYIHWNYDFGWGILTDHNYGLNADWDISHSICKDAKGDYWAVEARYALAHFELQAKVGYIFGFEPARFRYEKALFNKLNGEVISKSYGQWMGWGSQGKNHHNADGYGKVVFVEKAPKSVADGLKLAYPDLDKRVILVQTGSEYAVFDHGKVSTLTYAEKAKELVAETRKLALRYQKFASEVSNVVWKTSAGRMQQTAKAVDEFAKVGAETTKLVDAESFPRQDKVGDSIRRGKDSASTGQSGTASTGKEIDIAFIGELEKKCGAWNDAFDRAYWGLVRDAMLIEKKTRVPVTLHPDQNAPALNSEFADRTMQPETRQLDVVEWAKPLAGGRKKVFITVNAQGGIDAWQLAKRMDIDATIFQCTGNGDGRVGVTEDYYNEGLWFDGVKRQELERALKEKGPFDCFVFLGTWSKSWPEELQCWLLEQMLAGAKVIEKNGSYSSLLNPMKPLGDVAAGCPKGMKRIASVKGGGVFETEYIPVKLDTDPLKASPFGKGLYARFATDVTSGWAHGTRGTPAWPTRPDNEFQDEYGFAYLVRNVMQVLGCREGRRAVDVGEGLSEIPADAPATVAFRTAGPTKWDGEIAWKVRDLLGNVLQEDRRAVAIPAGTNHVSLALKPLPAGEYYVDATLYAQSGPPGGRPLPAGGDSVVGRDLLARRNRAVIDFASGRVVAANREKFVKCGCSPLCTELVKTPVISEFKLAEKTLFSKDAPVRATVKVAPVAAGLKVRAEIRDVRERVIVRKDFPVDAADGIARIELKNAPEYDWTLANLDVTLVSEARVLDKKSAQFFRHRGDTEDYQVFVNNPEVGGRFGKHRLAYELYHGVSLFQKAGTTDTLSYGGDVVYRDRIPGGAPDKGGSLSNPYWLKDLRNRYGSHARSLKAVNGRFVSLGDDSGEPNDFPQNSADWVPCWCGRQLKRISQYAEQWKREGANKPIWQATRQWFREYSVEGMQPAWTTLEGWNFEIPLRVRASAIFRDGKRTPEQFKEYVDCFKEVYGSIEKFNRAANVKAANWEAVTPELMKDAKWDSSPEYVNFLFWLQKRYQNDIAKLNAAWKTDVKSFVEIPRSLIDDKLAEGVYTPSFDMQTFLEDAFIEQGKAIAEGIHGVDPSIGLGFGASTLGNTFCDAIKWIDSVCPYEGSYDIELLRGQKHKFIGECIGVYGGRNVPEPMRKKQVWHGLLTGCNFSWFWCTSYLPGDSTVDARQHGAIFEAYREVKRGPAALCLRSKRDNYGVKIMVSRDAGHFGPILSDMSTHGGSVSAFGSLFESLGVQWDSVTGEQVAKGDILRDGTKVLLLPYLQAVRAKEVEVIREFVKRGGTVFADARVGLFDEKCIPYAKPMLDELFGVETGPKAMPRICDIKVEDVGRGRGRWAFLPSALVDTSVKSTTAMALGRAENGAVAFLVNTNGCGRGRAVLFNFNLAVIPFLDGRGELGGVRQLLEQLIADAGLKPMAVMKDEKGETVTGTEFTKFVRGDAIYLGVEKRARSCEKLPMEAFVELDKKYWVYDVRVGKKVGFTDKIPMTLGGLDIGLYSLLPAEAKAIELDIPATIKPGEALKATAKLNLQPSTFNLQPNAVRVFRWELMAEGGYNMEDFAPYPWRVKDAPVGVGATEWAIGYNVKPGTKYTAVVTDVETGLSASKTVSVE